MNGIDLDQRSVGFEKCLVQAGQKLHGGIDLLAAQSEHEGDLARLEGFESHAGIDVLLENCFGSFGGDLLDIHATGSRRHENRLAFGAIDQDSEIKFFFDRQGFFDQQVDARCGLRARSGA